MGGFYSRIFGVRRGRNAVGQSEQRPSANGKVEHTNGTCVPDDTKHCFSNECAIRKLSDDLILR